MSLFSGLKRRINATLDPFLHPDLSDVFDTHPLFIYDVRAAGEVFCPIESPPGKQLWIFGFEPVKKSHDSLVQAYADNPFIEIRRTALSDHDRTLALNVANRVVKRPSASGYATATTDSPVSWIPTHGARQKGSHRSTCSTFRGRSSTSPQRPPLTQATCPSWRR